MDKKKIYMGFPTNGSVVDAQAYALRALQERYGDKVEFVYPEKLVNRIFHDFARNAIVEEFLESDCDVLWMLDSDVVPPTHVLDLVTVHWEKWEVSGAAYPVFMTQPGEELKQLVFTAYRGTNGLGMGPSRIPYSGEDLVDGLATGCLFIKRDVFKKLEKPYFEFKYDETNRKMREGEDLGFCLKLQKLGIKFFTDFSMVCKHYKNVDLLEMNNYAITFANKAVENYDRIVREQVAKLAAQNEALKEKIAQLTEGQKPQPKMGSGLLLPNHF